MAPLVRPAAAALAALLLFPAALRAQTEQQDAQAAMARLKTQYSGAAQKPAESPAKTDPGKLRASMEVVAQAGLKASDLIDASPDGMNWLPANIADLGPAIAAASDAVRKLHEKHPSEVSAMPYGNGTMVNLEDSLKALTGLWGGGALERGCQSHQAVTFEAVAPVLRGGSLDVRRVSVLRKIFPHHAVIVFPKGTDWKKTGVVFDGWIHQEPEPKRMTYTFKDWYGGANFKAGLE